MSTHCACIAVCYDERDAHRIVKVFPDASAIKTGDSTTVVFTFSDASYDLAVSLIDVWLKQDLGPFHGRADVLLSTIEGNPMMYAVAPQQTGSAA